MPDLILPSEPNHSAPMVRVCGDQLSQLIVCVLARGERLGYLDDDPTADRWRSWLDALERYL